MERKILVLGENVMHSSMQANCKLELISIEILDEPSVFILGSKNDSEEMDKSWMDDRFKGQRSGSFEGGLNTMSFSNPESVITSRSY